MNILSGTMEEIHENNTKNTTKSKNVISNIIEGFKTKIFDIISPKKSDKITVKKSNYIQARNNNNVQEKNVTYGTNNSNKKGILFINKKETESILNKLSKNKAEISNLSSKLSNEKKLLEHFEKIKKYIPSGAEKEISLLKKTITEIEDKLIQLEIENLKINSKLNPLRKLELNWSENIFNPDNNKEKADKIEFEDKIEKNLENLKSSLELEKKLLAYFETNVIDNKNEIIKIKENIKHFEDKIIILEKLKLKRKTKSYRNQIIGGEKNIFNSSNNQENKIDVSTEEKSDMEIEKLEQTLLLEKKLLKHIETENSADSTDIFRIKNNIRIIEDKLIKLRIQKIRNGNKNKNRF